MKIPGMELYYKYTLSDEGGVYKKSRRCIANSFLTGYHALFFAKLGLAKVAEQDTGNTSRNWNGYASTIVGPAGNVNYGIVVGTGTNAVDVTDYALQTRIAHGSGGGQLQYSATTVAAPTFVGSTAELIFTRLFTNASGSTVTIEELGVYYYASIDASISVSNYLCGIRDVATVAITNGTTLTLNYIIQTTV